MKSLLTELKVLLVLGILLGAGVFLWTSSRQTKKSDVFTVSVLNASGQTVERYGPFRAYEILTNGNSTTVEMWNKAEYGFTEPDLVLVAAKSAERYILVEKVYSGRR